jgi:hypothetical protein
MQCIFKLALVRKLDKAYSHNCNDQDDNHHNHDAFYTEPASVHCGKDPIRLVQILVDIIYPFVDVFNLFSLLFESCLCVCPDLLSL